jgi:hypothetical protein
VALGPVFWLGVHERNTQLSWIAPLTLGKLWEFAGAVVGSTPTSLSCGTCGATSRKVATTPVPCRRKTSGDGGRA